MSSEKAGYGCRQVGTASADVVESNQPEA